MKLSALAKEIRSKYNKRDLTEEDIFQLYREGFIEYEELKAMKAKEVKRNGIWFKLRR